MDFVWISWIFVWILFGFFGFCLDFWIFLDFLDFGALSKESQHIVIYCFLCVFPMCFLSLINLLSYILKTMHFI